MSAEQVARAFHEAYEQLAPEFGYQTREASAKPWAEVPAQNKALMIAVVERLLESGSFTRLVEGLSHLEDPGTVVTDAARPAVLLNVH